MHILLCYSKSRKEISESSFSVHLEMRRFDLYKLLYHADSLKALKCVSAQIISTHVISLKYGANIIPLCVRPASYDPNPRVLVHVCGRVCVCVSHGPILPPSVSQLISVSVQHQNRGGKKYRELTTDQT